MVWDYFSRSEWEGAVERIHHALYVAVREQAGREASPDDGNHRPPDREACAKRGSTLDPSG